MPVDNADAHFTPLPHSSISLKQEFLEIIQGTSALFSWQKEAGVKYVNLSDESTSILDSWKSKKIEHGSQQIPATKIPHPSSRQNLTNKIPLPPSRQNITNKIEDGTQKKSGNNPIPSDSFVKMEISKEAKISFYGDLNAGFLFLIDSLNMFEKEKKNEDENVVEQSDPYSGPAGELFLKIIKAMNLTSEQICLCSFEKLDYSRGIPAVRQQVSQIREKVETFINKAKPRIICTMGDNALKILMGREYMLTSSRGRFHHYQASQLQIPVDVMPTYHPSVLLENPAKKREVWEDMQQIMNRGTA